MEAFDKIKRAGLKLTPQRQAVYEAMTDLRHAQLETIVAHLKEQGTTMTLSTVYRVLESFVTAGVLSLVSHPESGETFYDITTRSHHHLFGGSGIHDYQDDELTDIVRQYMKEHRPDLKNIDRIQIQVILRDSENE